MEQVKIYALIHPTTKEVRYVGKTNGSLKRRLMLHVTESKAAKDKTHKHNWIMSLLNANLKPVIVLLEEVNEDIWQQKEIEWISRYTNLTNSTEGGEGNNNQFRSKESKIKTSISVKRAIENGLIITPERNAKISQSLTGIKRSEETKQKVREANLGKVCSLETKLKKSKGVLQFKDGILINEFISLRDASEKTNIPMSSLQTACTKAGKICYGYTWEYKKKI